MPVVLETVTINADIESVFDLIARVEEFPLYTDALKEVRKISRNTYRWVAQIQGMTLNWDSIISEWKRPTRLAWRSIRGFGNSGAYTLTPAPTGTVVSISIEYGLPSRLFEILTAPLVTRITRAVAAEVLARVKDRLESGPSVGVPEKRTATRIKRLGFALRKPPAARHV